MAIYHLGRTLAIANPTSHSGRGAAGAEAVRRFFESFTSATTSFDMQLTTAMGDAERMAAAAGDYDTVFALGGDGLIHEVVNGLMSLPASSRPRLGIIPLGSGNDFAQTLSVMPNNPEVALHELLTSSERALDMGYVTSDACSERTYFTESLSFGLDAAIALDTTARRAKGTRQQGSGLFLTSSIKLALHASKGYPCVARIDGEEPLQLTSLIFAVLNGPTYGGGFRICPAANPCDGVLDICYNVRRPWVGRLMFLLGLARFGKHTRSKIVRLRTARTVQIEFAQDVPCQVDGEELLGVRFDVGLEPAAIRVLVPKAFRW